MTEFQRKVIDSAARLASVCHDLLDRIEALEQAIKPATPPDPAIKPVPAPDPTPPPVRRVTLEELAERQGWKEAAIAWECCASIHREYAKGRDPLFKTRQSDFGRAADAARAKLARQQGEP